MGLAPLERRRSGRGGWRTGGPGAAAGTDGARPTDRRGSMTSTEPSWWWTVWGTAVVGDVAGRVDAVGGGGCRGCGEGEAGIGGQGELDEGGGEALAGRVEASGSRTETRRRALAASSVGASGWSVRARAQSTEANRVPAADQAASTWRRTQVALASMSRPVRTSSIWLRKPPRWLRQTLRVSGGAEPRTPLIGDPVGAGGGELDGVEVGGDVGAEVGGGLDLVDQLGGDRVDGDQAAGAVVLGDDRGAVGGDLGDREAERGVGAAGVEEGAEAAEVAAGGLGAALDDVAGHDGAGELVVRRGGSSRSGRRPGRRRPRRR